MIPIRLPIGHLTPRSATRAIVRDLRAALGDLALQRGDASLVERAWPDSMAAGGRRARGEVGHRGPVGGRAGRLRGGIQTAPARNRRRQALLPRVTPGSSALLLAQRRQPPRNWHASSARRVRQPCKRSPTAAGGAGCTRSTCVSARQPICAAFKPPASTTPATRARCGSCFGRLARRRVIRRAATSHCRPKNGATRSLSCAKGSACRMQSLVRLLDGAEAVLDGRDPPASFFVAGAGEQWQEILLALQVAGRRAAGRASGERRACYGRSNIGEQGRLLRNQAARTEARQRGWSRPRAISLAECSATAACHWRPASPVPYARAPTQQSLSPRSVGGDRGPGRTSVHRPGKRPEAVRRPHRNAARTRT